MKAIVFAVLLLVAVAYAAPQFGFGGFPGGGGFGGSNAAAR